MVFDKLRQLGDLKKLRDQALAMQRALREERVEVEEGGVRVVITGDQQIEEFSIQGSQNQVVVEVLNKAIKKSQELAAKKLQEISGGLKGLS